MNPIELEVLELAMRRAHFARHAPLGRPQPPEPPPPPAKVEPPRRRLVFTAPIELEAKPGPVTIRQIQTVIAGYFALTRAEIVGKQRARHVSFPRMVGYFLAGRLTKKSLPEIGRAFGGRDHTTVLSGKRKMAGLVDTDPTIRELIHWLEARLDASGT